MLNCEVVGIDPTYSFPRVCDATPTARIFRKSSLNKLGMIRSSHSDKQKWSSESESNRDNSRMIVELKAKCYNATLAIAKHKLRCPWCSQGSDSNNNNNDIAIVEHYLESDSSSEYLLSSQVINRDQFMYAALIFVCAISAILSASFACLLIAYLRQKRNSKLNKTTNDKQHLYHQQPTHLNHPLAEFENDDSRYEIPWEQSQQYQPLPYYRIDNHTTANHNRSSDMIISSPLDSTSIIATVTNNNHNIDLNNMASTKRLQFNHNNSSSCAVERRDDSGLGSV
ncbi:unnamed protein product [Anisakis simplex]|uniref:C2 domain-containing protein n=1 Tax=Anisakis simplex TaxID=6269 RepID=A0A0M3J491_ANISI|nr:unnamed protein product [Anisakis simplex]